MNYCVVPKSPSLVLRPSLFSDDVERLQAPYGLCILDMLEALGIDPIPGCELCVYVEGVKVPIPEWDTFYPPEGAYITAVAVPLDGGITGNDSLRIVATIAVITAAVATGGVVAGLGFTGASIAGALTTAAISAGGLYAVNTLIPADIASETATENFDSGSTVTAQSNRINRGGPIPFIAGGPIRVFPQHAALPFTEVEGNNTRLRMLLCPGLGPLEITDIRIGQTPISSLGPDEVEVEVFEGRPTDPDPTLFSNDVNELNVGTEVRFEDGPVIRTTEANTSEISLDIYWPGGIIDQNSNGRTFRATILYRIEYRVSPAGPWLPFPDPTVGANGDTFSDGSSRRPFYRSFRGRGLSAAPNQYDVRVTRLTGDTNEGTNLQARQVWTKLRSIAPNKPVQRDDVALIALLIKRDGPVEAINCLVRSYAPTWTGAAWVEAPSNNPASVYRLALQGPANPAPLSDSGLRLVEDLQGWYDYNVAEGLGINAIFDDVGTVQQRIGIIAAAGHAQISRPDGRYGVAIDEQKITPVALITPRNSWGYRYDKLFTKIPNAIRCLFYNEEQDFAEDERLVFDDGFNEGNIDPARIEVLDLKKLGVTNPDQVWKRGRRLIAEFRLRPERYTVNQDVEQRVLSLGDLTLLQHDVMLVGLGSGRIKTVQVDGGGDAIGVTTDERFLMEAGKTYGFTIRRIATGNIDLISSHSLVTVPGEQTSFTFTTPIPAADIPAPRDLLAYGEFGVETIETVVRDITPLANDQAQLTLVPHGQPGIDDSETGPIPPFNTGISLPGDFFGRPPKIPIIRQIAIEQISFPGRPDVIATIQIIVSLDPQTTAENPPEDYQVRLREQGDLTWPILESFPGDATDLEVTPRETNKTYELQVRALGRSPRGIPNKSDWSLIGSIFVPEPETTLSEVGTVAGLELVGQGNNDEFIGRSPTFAWRFTSGPGAAHLGLTGGQVGFIDPGFAYFQIRILNLDGTVRRIEQVTTPQYTYDYDRNFEDGRKLGGIGATRAFTIEVRITDAFQQAGAPARLTVSNPAPATPTLSVSAGLSSIFVNGVATDDPDFAGIIVWASPLPGFTPGPLNEVARARQTSVTITAPSGAPLYIRAAFFDDFSSDVSELNISSEFTATPTDVADIPEFTFSGVTFEPNSPGVNQVSWTGGQVFITQGGVTTTENVAAGSATFTSGTLFLYYPRGLGQILGTTDPGEAAGIQNFVLATYRGGTDISGGTGKVFTDGATLIAQTVLGSAIIGGTITGNLLAATDIISDTAQIRTATIDTLNVKTAAITDIVTDFNTTQVIQTFVGTYQTILSGNIDGGGFNVSILFSIEYSADVTAVSSPNIACRVRVLRNGVSIQDWAFGGAVAEDGPAKAQDVLTILYTDPNPPPGPSVYEVQTKIDSASGQTFSLTIEARSLELKVTKR